METVVHDKVQAPSLLVRSGIVLSASEELYIRVETR
jgi:hypothetical protein